MKKWGLKMKYQNKNTFRIALRFLAFFVLGSICASTAYAQNENYSFVTKWGSSDTCDGQF